MDAAINSQQHTLANVYDPMGGSAHCQISRHLIFGTCGPFNVFGKSPRMGLFLSLSCGELACDGIWSITACIAGKPAPTQGGEPLCQISNGVHIVSNKDMGRPTLKGFAEKCSTLLTGLRIASELYDNHPPRPKFQSFSPIFGLTQRNGYLV
jgi:hypothetical protein